MAMTQREKFNSNNLIEIIETSSNDDEICEASRGLLEMLETDAIRPLITRLCDK